MPVLPVQQRTGFERFLEALYNYWPNALGILGTLLLASGGVWMGFGPADWWLFSAIVMFAVGGLLYFFSEWKQLRRTPLLTRLQERNTELEHGLEDAEAKMFSLFREQLRLLATKLAFTDQDRISAFMFEKDTDAFRLIGRYAKNPRLNAPGRGTYPKDQGCIARAWETGEALAALPDKRANEPAYYAALARVWKIPQDVAARFTMISRTMVGFALEDDRGDHIAVLIFESEKTNAFNLQKIKLEMQTERRRLSIFIQESAGLTRADEAIAEQAGF